MSDMVAPPFLVWLVTIFFIAFGLVSLISPRSVTEFNASLFRALGQHKNEQRALAPSQVLQVRIGGGIALGIGLFMVFYLTVQPLLAPSG
ncbi:hypothetical protein [Microcella sp.]|uniref:hypothetical protein n=1 Tax=Microcella sp. TaxID=1913979 RepID=UPI00391D6A82